jgi:hypothetical protein
MKPVNANRVIGVHGAHSEFSGSSGRHDFYKAIHSGKEHKITVDTKSSPFDDFLLKSTIAQSGHDRDQLYGATKNSEKLARSSNALTRKATNSPKRNLQFQAIPPSAI